MKLNQYKPKQLPTQTHCNQTAKNEEMKKKNHEIIWGNQHVTFQEIYFKWLQITHQNAWKPENATTFLNWWRKDLWTKNPVHSKNILWIQNDINIFQRERKWKQFVVSRSAHKELQTKVFHTEGNWYQEETWNIRNEGRATEVVNDY